MGERTISPLSWRSSAGGQAGSKASEMRTYLSLPPLRFIIALGQGCEVQGHNRNIHLIFTMVDRHGYIKFCFGLPVVF
jgi:hypothetical protein